MLDTHLLLWAAISKRLPREARELWKTTATRRITARRAFGKQRSRARFDAKIFGSIAHLLATLPEMGLVELPTTPVHAAGVTRLPLIHRDPFDRLSIAQSLVEPLALLTNDALFESARAWCNDHLS